MRTQVHLVRHGETVWSLTGQHTGTTELDLTAHGEDQARALAPVLRQTAFTHVMSSPRLRARRTCALAGLGDAVRTDPDLAEWDYGDYEGRRSVEIWRERPDWNLWRDGCPGGEQPAQVAARADRVIAGLCALRGCVAVFSHGQFGAVLAMRWIGSPVLTGQHFALHPASLSRLDHDARHPGRRLVLSWNQTSCSRSSDA